MKLRRRGEVLCCHGRDQTALMEMSRAMCTCSSALPADYKAHEKACEAEENGRARVFICDLESMDSTSEEQRTHTSCQLAVHSRA